MNCPAFTPTKRILGSPPAVSTSIFVPPATSPIYKQHPFCGLSTCEKILYGSPVLKRVAAPELEFSTSRVVALTTSFTVAANVQLLVPPVVAYIISPTFILSSKNVALESIS